MYCIQQEKKVTMDLRNLNDQIYHFSPPEAS